MIINNRDHPFTWEIKGILIDPSQELDMKNKCVYDI